MLWEGTFPIFLEGRPVGQADIQTQGLYVCFRCRCGPAQGEVLRLFMRGEDFRLCLGVPVPQDGELVLRKKRSLRSLPLRKVEEFYLSKEDNSQSMEEIAVSSVEIASERENHGNLAVSAVPEGSPDPFLWSKVEEELSKYGSINTNVELNDSVSPVSIPDVVQSGIPPACRVLMDPFRPDAPIPELEHLARFRVFPRPDGELTLVLLPEAASETENTSGNTEESVIR